MAELQLVSCAVRRGRPLLMSCSPLRNTIEWTHHAGTRRRGSAPFLPATSCPGFAAAMGAYRRADGFVLPSHEAGPNIFVAANCDACTRHRGGTPVEAGTSPANLTSGRTSVRTIIPNTGKAEFQEGGPILENGAMLPVACFGSRPLGSFRRIARLFGFYRHCIFRWIEEAKRHCFADDQAGFNTAPSGMTP